MQQHASPAQGVPRQIEALQHRKMQPSQVRGKRLHGTPERPVADGA